MPASQEHHDDHHDDHEETSDDEDDISKEYEETFTKCGGSTLDSAICGVYRLHYHHIVGFDLFEVLFSFFLFYLALLCKTFMLWIFFAYWVEFFEDPWEDSQYKPMQDSILRAIVTKNSLMYNATLEAQAAHMMCTLNRAPVLCHFMVLFLWVGVALNMMGDSVLRIYTIISLPDCGDVPDGHGVHSKSAAQDVSVDPPPGEREVKVHVSHLGMIHKAIIIGCCITPDFLLNLWVCWTGAKYICVLSNVGVLVKSFLKLNFIARVEKMVYPSFVSYNWNDFVSNSNYKVLVPKGMPNLFTSWYSTLSKILVSLAICRFFLYSIFPRVEEFRQYCIEYYEVFPSEHMTTGNWWYPEL